MRRTPILLAALLLIATASSIPSAQASGFADVPPGSFAAAAIADLASRGIMTGVGQDRFDPQGGVSREYLAEVLDRAFGVTPVDFGPPFIDVSPENPYRPAIEAAAGHSLMPGVSLTRFAPEAAVTGLMLARLLVRALGLRHAATDLGAVPSAVPGSSGLPPADRGVLRVAHDLGLLPPSPPIPPEAPITRADLAYALDRALTLPPASIAQEAALAAARLVIGGEASVLDVGQTTSFWSVVYDRRGYALPVPVDFYAHLGRMEGDVYHAVGAGQDRIVAYVPGTGLTAHATITVLAPSALAFAPLSPTLCVAGAPCPITVRVLARGHTDPLAALPLSLTWQGPSSGSAAADATAGVARFTPTLPSGTYALTVSGPGLPPRKEAIDVLPAPLAWGPLPSLPGTLAYGHTLLLRLPLAAEPPSGARLPLTTTVAGPLAAEASFEANAVLLRLHPTGTGTASVTIGAPGGAIPPLTLRLSIPPIGQAALSCPPDSPAGATVSCQVYLPGAPAGSEASVTFTLPDGSTAVASTTLPSTTVTTPAPVTRAGVLQAVAQASGYLPSPTVAVDVRPGPPVAFRAAVVPSPFVEEGSTVAIRASLVDRYGNPTAGRVPVTVSVPPDAPGILTAVRSSVDGATTVATYKATASQGKTTVLVLAPGRAPIRLVVQDTDGPLAPLHGYGLWLPYWVWRDTPDAVLLARARALGAHALYLEVATTDSGGFYGGPGLDDLLQKAHALGLALYAWVFPDLYDVPADTAFSIAVGRYRSPLGAAVDGLALDLETNLAPAAVTRYVSALRQALQGLPLLAVTYPPSYGAYPWAALAPYVDAILPMDYWHVYERDDSYDQVYRTVAGSIATIRAADGNPSLPVLPIAQTYDAFGQSGLGAYSPTATEEEAAIQAAEALGAAGMSFYQMGTMTRAEAEAITLFPYDAPPVPPHPPN